VKCLTLPPRAIILDHMCFGPWDSIVMKSPMRPPAIAVLLAFVATLFRAQASLCRENLALRHQRAVSQQAARRPRLRASDRLFWAWLSRLWSG
jgi:hypothetical protein